MSTNTVVIVNADTGSLDFFVAGEAAIQVDSKRALLAQPLASCSGECAEMLGGHCRGAECPYAPDVEAPDAVAAEHSWLATAKSTREHAEAVHAHAHEART